jgi:hypothetical protein
VGAPARDTAKSLMQSEAALASAAGRGVVAVSGGDVGVAIQGQPNFTTLPDPWSPATRALPVVQAGAERDRQAAADQPGQPPAGGEGDR